MIFRKKASFIALAAVFASGNTSYLLAQDTNESEQREVRLEEIVVTGIRQSLRDAIDIKRSYVGTMEAISAEDFGKFPDGNVAESLARVPGIAIDRSNVEGERIAVRGFGPEFNLVTLNGRQMPTAPGVWSGGRSFNFGDIASPGISAVEVFKSVNSTLPSGGIGATVNMVTTKPLNIDGTKRAFSLNMLEDTTSKAGDTPIETALLYATNQDRWGFSIAASYQERTNREEGTRESNWITVDQMAENEGYYRVDPTNPDFANNNDRVDGNVFYQEPSSYQIKDNERIRTNAQATFQYAWNDDVVSTIDYTYSNVDFKAEGVMFGSWLGGWDTLDANINENGAFTDVVVGNRAYDHEVIWQDLENKNKSIGFNTQWQVNDALMFDFDAHHSSAEVIGGELNNSIGFTTDIQGTITHENGGSNGINSFSYDTDFQPENYLATSATIRDGYKENVIDQLQIKGEWVNLDGGWLGSVDFGISHLKSDFTKIRQVGNFSGTGNTAADYSDSLFVETQLGDFMNSFAPEVGTSYYYDIDPQAALSAFVSNNAAVADVDGTLCCAAGDVESNDRVNETLQSAYVQLNMESIVADRPLEIVAGLRYESAETESISYFPIPDILRWDMIAGLTGVNSGTGPIDAPAYGESSMILPSLSFAYSLDDDKVIRLSASKSMVRPDLVDLSSEFEIGNNDFFQPTAIAGNPQLQPLRSNNFDISYEDYYGDESYFAVNYFIKEISDFVGTRTTSGQQIEGLTDPTNSPNAQFAMECVRDWVAAGRPDPGFPGDPGATGDCVSQQAIWAQGWMNDQQHMGWVALGMENGIDVSGGYPWAHGGLCGYDGWWRCDPGYIDGTASDPAASFEVTSPYNMNKGTVKGFEFALQHVWEDTPFGMQVNATRLQGGDVKVDNSIIGEQFVLPGFGNSGNLSFFYEDDRHTARIALNYRGTTIAGFANYEQPLYVEARSQVDLSYQFRYNENVTLFADVQNLNDEPTRLYVRSSEMLFLSQDHGPIARFGFRTNF